MISGDDNQISYFLNNKPPIILQHADGPVLRMPDGSMHWLTLRERISLAVGLHDLNSLVRLYKKKLKGRI